MNRIIKFRAWSPKFKKMTTPFNLYPDGEKTVQETYVYSDTILMQFTGLLDKNGKEIYEGDILSDKEIMEWSDEEALWGSRNIGTGPARVFYSKLEVIGNIYENKELLED